jgi:hypothetical protein
MIVAPPEPRNTFRLPAFPSFAPEFNIYIKARGVVDIMLAVAM